MASDIDVSRRQAFMFATGDAVQVVSALWSALSPAINTVQAALDSADAVIAGHFSGSAHRHAASAVDCSPRGFVGSANVQAALNELVDDLSSTASGSPGAIVVGADAVAGTPNAMAAGNVDGQLSQLLGFVNSHLGTVTGAHNASAVAVADVGNNLAAVNVEAALAELIGGFLVNHYSPSDTSGGQHKVIRQPNLGGTKALLWDSVGSGGAAARFRVYADGSSIWFTMNAVWAGTAWTRDSDGDSAGGFRFSRTDFEVYYQPSGTGSFANFGRRWRLPMSSATNSAFELNGTMQEEGRLGTAWSNSGNSTQNVTAGGSSTFRNRFAATPSSITLSVNYYTVSDTAPYVLAVSRDGFGYFGYRSLMPGQNCSWMGTYTATA